MSRPLLVAESSRMEEALGELVPIPTCAADWLINSAVKAIVSPVSKPVEEGSNFIIEMPIVLITWLMGPYLGVCLVIVKSQGICKGMLFVLAKKLLAFVFLRVRQKNFQLKFDLVQCGLLHFQRVGLSI